MAKVGGKINSYIWRSYTNWFWMLRQQFLDQIHYRHTSLGNELDDSLAYRKNIIIYHTCKLKKRICCQNITYVLKGMKRQTGQMWPVFLHHGAGDLGYSSGFATSNFAKVNLTLCVSMYPSEHEVISIRWANRGFKIATCCVGLARRYIWFILVFLYNNRIFN